MRIIFDHIQAGDWEWIISDAMVFEIERTGDPDRRERVRLMLRHAADTISGGEVEEQRMLALVAAGFRPLDALHLACAESGNADLFLTTDDRLHRLAARHSTALMVRVVNPLSWLQEILGL